MSQAKHVFRGKVGSLSHQAHRRDLYLFVYSGAITLLNDKGKFKIFVSLLGNLKV